MRLGWLIILTLLAYDVSAQSPLKPGFDPHEYEQLLSLTFHSSSIGDSVLRKTATDPFRQIYRSEETGLLNRWTLYLKNDNTAVIDIRGTVNKPVSWLANFYAAMIPATGTLQLADTTTFPYKLAEDPKAMVHAGWTVSLGSLAPQIVKQINELAREQKVTEYLLFGHSQGASICFLLRSYLHYEQQAGRIPSSVRFKTYCSAAPKPGNLFYAYDFDFLNRGGWQFTVVNAADWVPELPFSIQTTEDLNTTNPFVDLKAALRRQKLMMRAIGGYVYNKLEKKPRKAAKKFEKYLGKQLYKRAIRKALPGLTEPDYTGGNNYTRAGSPVILMPDDEYRNLFPDSKEKLFVHHLYPAYHFLLNKHYLSNR